MKTSKEQKWHSQLGQNWAQTQSWKTRLGHISVSIFKIAGDGDRLYLSATGLLSHVDLMIDADSKESIDTACEEALAIVRQAIVDRLTELRKEIEHLEIALAASHE